MILMLLQIIKKSVYYYINNNNKTIKQMNKKQLEEINNKFVNLLDIIKDNQKEIFNLKYKLKLYSINQNNLELNKHLDMNKQTLSNELQLYMQKNDIEILL